MLKPATVAIALLATSINCVDAKPFKEQIKISLPAGDFTAHQRTQAKVTNSGNVPITYCVESGRDPQGVLSADDMWPEPFYIQISASGKWRTPVGCGTGVIHSPVTLKSGESQEYPLKFAATGKMRLLLEYWRPADTGSGCTEIPKHTRVARSRAFVVK